MLEVYFAWLEQEHGSSRLAPGSDRWRIVRPWKATYWKTLPEGVRVRYREAEDSPTGQPRCSTVRTLWSSEWSLRRHAEMRRYVPMRPKDKEPVIRDRWRIVFRDVAERAINELPALLDHPDSGVQYAAATRLAQSGDSSYVPLLLNWFQERRSRWALRPISRVRNPVVLHVLVGAFEQVRWGYHFRDATYCRDLGRAIASFGDEAVSWLAPLLRTENDHQQLAVLDVLGATNCDEAGRVILDWIGTLEPRRTAEHYHIVECALLALAALKDVRALPFLSQFINHAPDYAVKPLVLLDNPRGWKILEDFLQSGASIHRRRWISHCMAAANPAYHDVSERLKREAESELLRHQTSSLVAGDYRVEIDDPVAALTGVLLDSDPGRRVLAITLICEHPQQFPRDPIIHLLNDPVPAVRANAVYALGLRGSLEDLSRLSPLQKDSSGVVRYCARGAIERLSAQGQVRPQ